MTMNDNGAAGAGRPVRIDVAVEAEGWPDAAALAMLARRAVAAASAELELGTSEGTELSLVFTDDERIRTLNAEWRNKDQPTNVLSFPAYSTIDAGRLPPMLGDIVLARETILREADLEEKRLDHHLTHLIVHGFLHLLGYDHESDAMAEEMESVERRILAALAIPDPYAVTRSGD